MFPGVVIEGQCYQGFTAAGAEKEDVIGIVGFVWRTLQVKRILSHLARDWVIGDVFDMFVSLAAHSDLLSGG
jgi:hypothetical protein